MNFDSRLKISVIIPAYQARNHIAHAIDAAFFQTYRPIEVVIIDDGSYDGTEQVANDYLIRIGLVIEKIENKFENEELISNKFSDSSGKFIVVYIKQPNSGPSKARNIGIKYSSGDVIAFLDVDDTWSKDKLELQISLFERSACQFVFTNTVIKSKSGKEKIMYPSVANLPFEIKNNIIVDSWRSLISTNFVTTSSVLALRSCFGQGRVFSETRRLAEDWELWLTLSNKFTFGYVPEVCVIKKQVEGSLSGDNMGMLISSIEVLENFLKDKFSLQCVTQVTDLQVREVLFTSYKWAGYSALMSRNRQLARKYLFNALKVRVDLQTAGYYLRACSPF